MSDLLRVTDDYKVYWLGEEVGILSTPIKTEWMYDNFRYVGYEPYLREMGISFRMVEPPIPPKPKKRTRTEALGLRRPK
ncbi:hypothetical protein KIV66_gp36 [Mycobacterium phage MyraDee]|uniref:Uncharacterized protein n=1 Tax=Mycobacterium phage MyraDee TaxID=2024303 RepID=A0A222YZ95_9CAUD|nr:hypothetical protein KIV66_gp36 [Mycobacterium phage MyraDee]ASR77144.1 hypothetical protein SEA_MYRADEE_36 [Mycobacterium phage MyraDee]